MTLLLRSCCDTIGRSSRCQGKGAASLRGEDRRRAVGGRRSSPRRRRAAAGAAGEAAASPPRWPPRSTPPLGLVPGLLLLVGWCRLGLARLRRHPRSSRLPSYYKASSEESSVGCEVTWERGRQVWVMCRAAARLGQGPSLRLSLSLGGEMRSLVHKKQTP